MSDYWKECLTEAFDEVGITATEEQVAEVASWVAGAHENYGMAHGHDCIPNPLQQENERLAKALKEEQSKSFCKECHGTGEIWESFAGRTSNSQCNACRGAGKI